MLAQLAHQTCFSLERTVLQEYFCVVFQQEVILELDWTSEEAMGYIVDQLLVHCRCSIEVRLSVNRVMYSIVLSKIL